MKLWSNSFNDGGLIPSEFAFGAIDPTQHVALSANQNPHLAWEGEPHDAKSLALICHDPDAPSRGDDVNQQGKTVAATLPRVDFFHWVMIDLPLGTKEIKAGQFSHGVTLHGKPGPAIAGMRAVRHGLNDYTNWFAGDDSMAGNYFGYDGPCPPWNDSIFHHYVFTLYALDVERLSVEGGFTGPQVRAAILKHLIAQVKITGRYTLNPELLSA